MSSVVVIAEAGVNHNGSIEIALQLIDAAAEAGADYVKFQSFIAENMANKNAPKAIYQEAESSTDKAETQLQMLRKLELTKESHHTLITYCESKNIKFLSSAFDIQSIYLLKELGIKTGKIPSGEITNLPYLRVAADSFQEIILSTGMSTIKEIEDAMNIFLKNGISRSKITILHCNTEYPTPFSDVNLNSIHTLRDTFGVNVGYSDHTLGIEVPIAAVAMGATMIEKHFTLSKDLKGPDHKASLEPSELKEMIKCIHNIESALGDGQKRPSLSEVKNISIVRKSIVAAVPISKGEILSEKNVTTKRPGFGISPMNWDQIIGQRAIRDFEADDLIET